MFVLPGSFTGARHVAKSRVPRKGAEKPEPEPEASIVDESVSLDRLQILKQPHLPPFQHGSGPGPFSRGQSFNALSACRILREDWFGRTCGVASAKALAK